MDMNLTVLKDIEVLKSINPNKTFIVDVTLVYNIFKTKIKNKYTNLTENDILNLFKIGIESYFIIYNINNGYIDEHYMEIITYGINNSNINIKEEDSELFPSLYMEEYNLAFSYIHDFIPKEINKVNLLPTKWEINNNIKIFIGNFPNLNKYYWDIIDNKIGLYLNNF